MTMPKSRFYSAAFILALSFFPTAVAAAVTKLPTPLGTDDIPLIIQRVIQAFLGVVGSIALIVFVYGGFLWLTAMGEDKRVKQGWDTMTWAAMGLAVIFSSYAVLQLLLNSIAGTVAPSHTVISGSAPAPAPAPTPSASTPAPTPAAPASPLLSGEEACTLAGGTCGIISDGTVVKASFDGSTTVEQCGQVLNIPCPGKQVCCKKDTTPPATKPIETDRTGNPCTNSTSNDEDCGRMLESGMPVAPAQSYSVAEGDYSTIRFIQVPLARTLGASEKSNGATYDDMRQRARDSRTFRSALETIHERNHIIAGEMVGNKNLTVTFPNGIATLTWGIQNKDQEGIYLGDGKGIILKTNKNLSINTVRSFIPAIDAFQNTSVYDSMTRHATQTNPIIYLDEFAAFNSEGRGSLELYKKNYFDENGLPKTIRDIPKEDRIGYEFNHVTRSAGYVPAILALALAIESKDPQYLAQETQLKETVRLLIEDAAKLYKTKEPLPVYATPNVAFAKNIYDTLRTNNDPKTKALRDLARRWFNTKDHPNWTKTHLDF